MFKVQQMLSESRRENMNLTRRLRLLTDYNFKSIKNKAGNNEKGLIFVDSFSRLVDEQLTCDCLH